MRMTKLDTLTISHTTRSYPRLPFYDIKNSILGKQYKLSLVFVGATRAQHLNQTLRNKNYAPDILSLPLGNKTGEIFICLPKVKRKAPLYHHTYKQHVAFLFIHGLLHLKGYAHGATMEKAEAKYCRKFAVC